MYKAKTYTLTYIKNFESSKLIRSCGAKTSYYDSFAKKWRLRIQLDDEAIWFLSVFINIDGSFATYALDRELENDSHFEFFDEESIRKLLYVSNDENLYLDEILIRYIKQEGGDKLLRIILPFVTAQFHY